MPLPADPGTLAELAAVHGTPLYVLSGERVRARVAEIRAALPSGGRLLYSVKANPAPLLLRMLISLGLDLDVCSSGDVALALAAGCPPDRLSYVGSGMAPTELDEVVRRGIPFVADSLEQLRRHAQRCPGGTVGLRLNPGLRSGFHEDVQAGRRDSKFGIQSEQVADALAIVADAGVRIIGLHAHIGSEVATHHDHVHLLEQLLDHAERVPTVAWVNLGGGWSVPIHDEAGAGLHEYDLGAFSRETAGLLARFSSRTGRRMELRVEPGSYLVMDAGCLVVDVTEIKPAADGRAFVLTDGSTDLIYSAGAYRTRHPVWALRDAPVVQRRGWVVAGPLMQAGDILAEDPWLPDLEVGDLLAFGMCGAYKAVRTSNFNERTRPAEVLIDGDRVVVLRDRETIDDLLRRYRTEEAAPGQQRPLGARR